MTVARGRAPFISTVDEDEDVKRANSERFASPASLLARVWCRRLRTCPVVEVGRA